ncbi:hypothetical protein Poli38472_014712 [Pythium oligandrum]|uniref:Uncharacterized protein n=1 Tax=Pythium oligandrum TaxID=41045 RepID=A0A8K1FLN1_PYTOL|nr:hypothetical protein Poli38472_014712 [Pythium oligandrum]|eukprot:TMW64007.1 hypothetical protein Poli38472_014712 [Pythium oligandrum]
MIPRNLWHMASGLVRRKITKPEPGALYLYPSVWRSRAGLKDCNFGDKLTENAFLRHMELSVWYACGSMGLLHACARNRWYFVFGSQGVRVFKDIKAFQAYEVHSRVIYWDDDWQFLLAQFKCPETGELYAEGMSRVMLRQGRERVNPRLLHEDIGLPNLVDKEEVPELVQKFLAWDAVADKSMKRTADMNAIRYANRKGPAVLSAYSMNLPFAMKQE